MNTALLDAHASAIHALGKRAIADIIEIGRRLTEAKALCGHGNWLSWLEREFNWSERAARRFMEVHALSLKSAKSADLTIDVSSLYLLAAPSTPAEVVEEVAELAKCGVRVSHGEVKASIERRRSENGRDAGIYNQPLYRKNDQPCLSAPPAPFVPRPEALAALEELQVIAQRYAGVEGVGDRLAGYTADFTRRFVEPPATSGPPWVERITAAGLFGDTSRGEAHAGSSEASPSGFNLRPGHLG